LSGRTDGPAFPFALHRTRQHAPRRFDRVPYLVQILAPVSRNGFPSPPSSKARSSTWVALGGWCPGGIGRGVGMRAAGRCFARSMRFVGGCVARIRFGCCRRCRVRR
jgi:hypothetical protein